METKPKVSKTVITISRLWHEPEIKTTVSSDGISLSMDITDFKTALKSEIPSIKWIFRKATFDSLVDKAFDRIIQGIKEESIKVV